MAHELGNALEEQPTRRRRTFDLTNALCFPGTGPPQVMTGLPEQPNTCSN
jgi:hypothetical protein